MILVISSKRDAHINSVARHLDAAGTAWVRLNTEDFATNVDLSLSPPQFEGTLRLRDSGRSLDVRQVRAVWYRKPEPPRLSHFNLDSAATGYMEAELGELLLGIYALLRDAAWINDPFSTRLSHRKPLQLRVARTVGFTTPRSLITNDPIAAMRFARNLGCDIAIKSLSAVSVTALAPEASTLQYGIFTRRVSIAELEQVRDKIACLPTLYQEFIEKEFELRITVVGEQIFACRIDHRHNDVTASDYRFDTKNLAHTPWDCPELRDRILAYMRFFNLRFGCFDIAVKKSGEPVFLECNPNGQWLWIENMTSLPIGQAIAKFLGSADQSHAA